MRAERPAGGDRLRAALPPTVDALLVAGLLYLALAVHAGWWPVPWDEAVERALPLRGAGGAAGRWLQVADHLTALASPPWTAAATVVLTLALAARRGSLAPVRFAAPRLIALGVTVLGLKALLRRPGPLDQGFLPLPLHGFFPSGHTATALVCTATLATLLVGHRPAWRVPLYTAVAGWTAAVAVGLVYDRYHWPSDVVGSLLLGALILRRLPRRRPPHAELPSGPPRHSLSA